MKTAIIIFGLPGAGKTELAKALQARLQCLWFNADKVRSTLSSDLGFGEEARLEQARRMGCLASLALDAPASPDFCIVDFVSPTLESFNIFLANAGKAPADRVSGTLAPPASMLSTVCDHRVFSICMNTIGRDACRFADTAAMFSLEGRTVDYLVDTWVDDFTALARDIEHRLFHPVEHPMEQVFVYCRGYVPSTSLMVKRG